MSNRHSVQAKVDIVGEPITPYLQPILEGRGEKICGVFGALRNPNHLKQGHPAPEGWGQGSDCGMAD